MQVKEIRCSDSNDQRWRKTTSILYWSLNLRAIHQGRQPYIQPTMNSVFHVSRKITIAKIPISVYYYHPVLYILMWVIISQNPFSTVSCVHKQSPGRQSVPIVQQRGRGSTVSSFPGILRRQSSAERRNAPLNNNDLQQFRTSPSYTSQIRKSIY